MQDILFTTSNKKIIETRDLGKTVPTSSGPLHILTGINLVINAGESLAIIGASGSGKSTLLCLLAGLDTPSQGEVLIQDQSLNSLDEDGRAKLRNKLIGFVFQSFQLLPSLTALENVMLPLELSDNSNAEQLATELLIRVELGSRLSHTPKQLSGGEQQRVALARAFVTQPKILFADEPTGNLDRKTGAHIIELLFQLNSEHQTTLVLVTHDSVLANRCQQFITLEAGCLV
jgi:putative ABC transport system ATP-binding protein